MKIAVVCTSDIPSSKANAIQVMKVMDSMLALGHQVRLWSPGEPNRDYPAIEKIFGVQKLPELSWLPSRKKWKRYDFIFQSFLQVLGWKPDILYTWTLQSALLGLWMGMPVILEIHDRTTGKVGQWVFKQFVKHKGEKRLLLITQALKEALENEQGVHLDEAWLQIAPNAIDMDQYQQVIPAQVAREQLNLPQQFTAVFTGHFYTGRGIELLFGLAQHVPQVHFLWVGGTEDLVASWRQRLDVAGVKNVTLTGFVPQQQIPLFQSAGDVLLMPYGMQIAGSSGGNSADICSPMKMFDYLATGRPILSSDLAVIREVLNDETTLFCPAKNIQAWADALTTLINDPQRCQVMGEHARATALGYTWLKRTETALNGFDEP
jgi:glycosyltransferase involved in cell wall biosynthesis